MWPLQVFSALSNLRKQNLNITIKKLLAKQLHFEKMRWFFRLAAEVNFKCCISTSSVMTYRFTESVHVSRRSCTVFGRRSSRNILCKNSKRKKYNPLYILPDDIDHFFGE